jgi:hypothetical protein
MLVRSVLLLAFTGSLVGGTVKSELTQLPCEEASNWVAWNADRLPTSLDAFETFDLNYRKRIYGAMSVEGRVAIWRARFDLVLADPSLAPSVVEELKLINRQLQTIILESPTGVMRGSDVDSRVKDLGRKIRMLVDPATARQLTGLGVQTRSRTSENCDCDTKNSNPEDDCPASDGGCKAASAGSPCVYQSFGCGDFWFYSCDGLCTRLQS